MDCLPDIFGLISPERRKWLEENDQLLASYREYGLEFEPYEGKWRRIPNTPEPPEGLVIPLPPPYQGTVLLYRRPVVKNNA